MPRVTRAKVTVKSPLADDSTQNEGMERQTLLPPSETIPSKLFILPQNLDDHARTVSLPHPMHGQQRRYLFCAKTGLYEFSKVREPTSVPRSWLVTQAKEENGIDRAQQRSNDLTTVARHDYISASSELIVATPYDALFLLLSILEPAGRAKEGRNEQGKRLFLTLDDHVDRLNKSLLQVRYVLSEPVFRRKLEARARVICDYQNIGDELMLRLSEEKLFEELLRKSRAMSCKGLPSSMETHFVETALRAPTLLSDEVGDKPGVEREEEPTNLDAQVSSPIPANDVVKCSTVLNVSSKILGLQRLRVAFNFILKAYIPIPLHSRLSQLLADAHLRNSDPTLSFAPLEAYLQKLTTLKAEATALRSISDNISRKRKVDSELDEALAEARAAKLKKEEDEEKKKKNESRALKNLKKANISGMARMDSFFKKAPAKKVPG